MPQNAEYLTTADLAKRWNGAVTVGTLRNWRCQGVGPAFIKIGARVRYPLERIKEWEARNIKGVNDNEH